jgi:tetratricopeptide (TPR) repeat protein
VKRIKSILFCLFVSAAIVLGGSAETELEAARTAIAEERYANALEHLARIQAFYYNDVERMAEALFYAALIYKKTEVPERSAQIIRELNRFHPDSPWNLKAKEEILKDQ